MTEKLAQILRTGEGYYVKKDIRAAFIDLVGPLTTRQIWELFSGEETLGFRDRLTIRGSAEEMSHCIIKIVTDQPDSSKTDAVLRIVQSSNMKKELYPGSKQDLGIN